MNKQLKPILGALVAGLVGVAQADCYMEASYVCQQGGQQTGGTYTVPGCAPYYIIADSDWYAWNVTSTTLYTLGGDGNLSLTGPYACQGEGHYVDCNTGQTVHIPTSKNPPTYYRIGTDPNYACTQQF